MKRILLWSIVATISLLLASPVLAQGRSITVKGEAQLGSKDMKAQTIELGDSVFQVTRETLLKDQAGRLIGLADIPVPEVGMEHEGAWEVIGGKFVAKRIGGDNVLIRLTLSEAPR